MANGRQRKRDVLLAKKAAEQAAKNGLAGLSSEGLTSIVSNDANDLDNVSYSTTNGATVNIKNNRVKDSTPTTNILGGRKGYMPGNNNTQAMDDELMMASNLGGRKGYKPGNGNFADAGPLTRSNLGGRKGYMPGSAGSQGPTTRSSRGFSFDDEMILSDGPNVRGSARPQAKAITEFIGEDLSPEANNRFYTVDMDSADDLALQQDDSVIGETLNDDGTVTYELPPSNLGNPEVTTTASTEAQLEPGMYDGVEPGEETALTPTLDNKGYNFDSEGNVIAEQPLFGRNTAEENATAAITMEEQLKEQALLRQLQADTKEAQSDNNIDLVQSQADRIAEQNGDLIGFAEGPTSRSSRGDPRLAEIDAINDGTVESKDSTELTEGDDKTITPETAYPNIHENEPGTTPPEVVAKEVKDSDNAITAATAGNHHLFEIANEAKREIEGAAEEVETGKTDLKTIADKVKNSLGSLGELLGIDGKDLIRALFRYAGGRIFGMSGNEAGRFMYEGFMTDADTEWEKEKFEIENSGLGADATANQKNLKAYNDYIDDVDTRVASGELTEEEGEKEKLTANQIFGVDKQQKVRNYNIVGRRPDGTEDVVKAMSDSRGNQLVLEDMPDGTKQWIPIEESNLTDIQETTKSKSQAFERGVPDPRNNIAIDNATYVSSGGVPTFSHKNESERKSYQLAKRAVDNYPIVDAMMKDPEMLKHITSAMGGLQTYAAGHANSRITAASINLAIGDSIPQKYRSATQAWLQALLRADTGAAYSETEIMDYIATNIPQVGDLPDTVAFKVAQMKSTTETMAANAGQGAKYLLGRLDGSVEPPESVKRLQALGMSTKTESDDADRSSELQSALDQY